MQNSRALQNVPLAASFSAAFLSMPNAETHDMSVGIACHLC